MSKAYGIHRNTASAWRAALLKKGAEIFPQNSMMAKYGRRIAELEQLLGRKELEIALLPALRAHLHCAHLHCAGASGRKWALVGASVKHLLARPSGVRSRK